jgi:hypothetical protein
VAATPGAADMSYAEIVEAFAGTGLLVRGGFAAAADEELPPGADGTPAGAVVLLGNAGTEMWPRFAAGREDEPDPLDAWTQRTVDPRAAALGVRAIYPNHRPYQPFQRWAMRAEPVAPSPIGLLIHPDHGLWHAYRAALLLDRAPADLPAREDRPSPCLTCEGRPCLPACPVRAHTDHGFDVDACTGHLRAGGEPRCLELGCRSRDGCPVGRPSRFGDDQVRFHLAAFLRARP